MADLWCRIIKKHRIASQLTEPLDEAASSVSLSAITDTLEEACRKLDVPRPIFLSKHEREYASHGKTYFTQDHFIERITFDRLEIEYIDPEHKPDKPRDPRSEA
ncbi:hypothetical protein FACS1894184_07160 [Clostridia bacterium]|nr:hypothetical protein FACS1894184_07160 [Clostridia bacterium]